jgi:hypothetical protein
METFLAHEVAAQEVLVKFRAADMQNVALILSALDVDEARSVGGVGVLRLHSRSKRVTELLARMAGREDVVYADPNYIVTQYPGDTPTRWNPFVRYGVYQA